MVPSPARVTRPAARRALLLATPALYVAVAAARAGETSVLAFGGIAAGVATGVAFAWSKEGAGERTRTRAWSTLGLSLALATSALTIRPAWATLARDIAVLGATAIAVRAVGEIEREPGLSPRATEADASHGFSPAILVRVGLVGVSIGYGAAALADALAWLRVSRGAAETAPMVGAVGGAFALFALGVVALLSARARRFELSAPPKALACAGAAGLGLTLAVAIAISGLLRADAAVAVGAAMASVAVRRVARADDALAVSRVGRRTLALALFGGPVTTLAAIAAEGHAPAGTVLFFAILAVLVGALGEKLEEPLLPVRGVLLDGLAEARRFAEDRDPREAIVNALIRVRECVGLGLPSKDAPIVLPRPELWMFHPSRVCSVDAAGYLREREAELPPSLLDIASAEPHQTLRTEVLRALEVRRADLRPLLRWLEDRGALSATVMGAPDAEPDGLLILPVGARIEPLTLDEVHATKVLADTFVAVCQARSARERHLARERELRDRIDALDDETATLRHLTQLDVGRNELASQRLARPATVGIYSAASRMAYEALERRIAQSAPVVVVARAGVDAVPYIARAHLAGPRRAGPLVVVDGTSSREHDAERWRDPSVSPLALADRGLLALVDGAALPRDVQVLLSRALAERRPPWERAMPLDVAIALTSTSAPDQLAEEGRLSHELFARLQDAVPIELPGLNERAEDLRAIVADRLAREGLRVHGRPIGIDAGAFSRLVEHPFEGGDAELAAIVTRLVARIGSGEVVRGADIDALDIAGRTVETKEPHGRPLARRPSSK